MKYFLSLLVVAKLFCAINGSCLTEQISPRGQKVDNDTIRDAIREYTLNQYKIMVTNDDYKNDNIFTSPYSMWAVLTMTYLGARGRTSQDLSKVVRLEGLDKQDVERQVTALQNRLLADGDTFNVANMLAFDTKVKLKSCVQENSLATLASLDLENDTNESIKRINRWVSRYTNEKIKKILSPDALSNDILMVMLNAVYFKGAWKYKFSQRHTQKDFFIVSPNEVREVDMMSLETPLNFYRSKSLGISAVELPYSSGRYSMVLVLPKDRNLNVNDVIKGMTAQNLKDITNGLREKFITLFMPRIKIEAKYQMNKVVEDLGAESVFSGVDLSGFADKSPPMKLSDVIHESFIEINEVGTEAAAASGVVTTSRGSNSHVTMKFNRPHVFYIKDNIDDVILFMGVIRKPQGTAFTAS